MNTNHKLAIKYTEGHGTRSIPSPFDRGDTPWTQSEYQEIVNKLEAGGLQILISRDEYTLLKEVITGHPDTEVLESGKNNPPRKPSNHAA